MTLLLMYMNKHYHNKSDSSTGAGNNCNILGIFLSCDISVELFLLLMFSPLKERRQQWRIFNSKQMDLEILMLDPVSGSWDFFPNLRSFSQAPIGRESSHSSQLSKGFWPNKPVM